MINLITRADDAGCCCAANSAILAALAGGVLKNVSIMVPGPAFDHAAELFAGIDGIDLGLHLTLNAEWPITKWGPVSRPADVPALVDQHGHFYLDSVETNKHNPPVSQLIAETEKQLDRARKKNLAIAYMDEHMGIGWLPCFRDALRHLAQREGLLYVEKKVPSLPFSRQGPGDALHRLCEAISATPHPVALHATHPLLDDPTAREMLRGCDDAQQVLAEREADRRLWLDERLPAALANLGVLPLRYSALP